MIDSFLYCLLWMRCWWLDIVKMYFSLIWGVFFFTLLIFYISSSNTCIKSVRKIIIKKNNMTNIVIFYYNLSHFLAFPDTQFSRVTFANLLFSCFTKFFFLTLWLLFDKEEQKTTKLLLGLQFSEDKTSPFWYVYGKSI